MSRRPAPELDLRSRVRALPQEPAHTRRLRLIFPQSRFGPDLVSLMNDPEIARWTLGIPHPYTTKDAREYYRRAPQLRRAGLAFSLQVVRRADGALLGGVGLHNLDARHRSAEIGYWIGGPYRGNGYAIEATRALCRLAHAGLGLDRLQAQVFPGNRASVRVLAGLGFRREGRLRGALRKDGESRDSVLYGRLRGDPLRPSSGGRSRRAGPRPSVAPAK